MSPRDFLHFSLASITRLVHYSKVLLTWLSCFLLVFVRQKNGAPIFPGESFFLPLVHTSHFDSSGHLYGNSNATMPIHSLVAHHSSSIYVCQAQITQKHLMKAIRAFLHTIWWRRVDIYSYSSHFDSSGSPLSQ